MSQPSAIFFKLFYFNSRVMNIEFILQMGKLRLFNQIIVLRSSA